MMCIPLHAYLVAQPHRLRAFEEALKHADANRDDVWITTAAEIAAYYRGALLGPDTGRHRGPGAGVGRDRIRAGGGGMSLPQEHLEYPRRRHGQDIDRYDWRLAKDRAPVRRADGADLSVMIVVACEFHSINPKKDPFNHPHGMVTPYPDLRHFTTRDYGNRVGVFRILRTMKARGVRATFALSADLLARAAPLAEAIVEDGHEIAAAGLNGDAIHHGALDEDEERRRIEAVRAAFERAGLAPKNLAEPRPPAELQHARSSRRARLRHLPRLGDRPGPRLDAHPLRPAHLPTAAQRARRLQAAHRAHAGGGGVGAADHGGPRRRCSTRPTTGVRRSLASASRRSSRVNPSATPPWTRSSTASPPTHAAGRRRRRKSPPPFPGNSPTRLAARALSQSPPEGDLCVTGVTDREGGALR